MAGDAPRKIRKQVTEEQISALLEFLQGDSPLARGRRGRASPQLWSLCAKRLNKLPGGVNKTPKGWSTYWRDLKNRALGRDVEINLFKAAWDCNNQAPPDSFCQPLTPQEEKIIEILAPKYNRPAEIYNNVVKTDQPEDVEPAAVEENDIRDNLDNVGKVTENNYELRARRKRKIEPNAPGADVASEAGASLPVLALASGRANKRRKLVADPAVIEITNEMLRIEQMKLEISQKSVEMSERSLEMLRRFLETSTRVADALENLVNTIMRPNESRRL